MGTLMLRSRWHWAVASSKMTLLSTPLCLSVTFAAATLTPDTTQSLETGRDALRACSALPAGAYALHVAGGPHEQSCSHELLEPRPSDPHSRHGVGESLLPPDPPPADVVGRRVLLLWRAVSQPPGRSGPWPMAMRTRGVAYPWGPTRR